MPLPISQVLRLLLHHHLLPSPVLPLLQILDQAIKSANGEDTSKHAISNPLPPQSASPWNLMPSESLLGHPDGFYDVNEHDGGNFGQVASHVWGMWVNNGWSVQVRINIVRVGDGG